jgi:phosphatidylserine decarboxylase
VSYIRGDTWNVNPIALKRIEKLFCKNERAVLRTRLIATSHIITLVPVAAVLVASIRLHFLDILLNRRHRGPWVIPCNARFRKGEEMGWFQHGSTIILFAPAGLALCRNVQEGSKIRMGQPLMRLPRLS